MAYFRDGPTPEFFPPASVMNGFPLIGAPNPGMFFGGSNGLPLNQFNAGSVAGPSTASTDNRTVERTSTTVVRVYDRFIPASKDKLHVDQLAFAHSAVSNGENTRITLDNLPQVNTRLALEEKKPGEYKYTQDDIGRIFNEFRFAGAVTSMVTTTSNSTHFGSSGQVVNLNVYGHHTVANTFISDSFAGASTTLALRCIMVDNIKQGTAYLYKNHEGILVHTTRAQSPQIVGYAGTSVYDVACQLYSIEERDAAGVKTINLYRAETIIIGYLTQQYSSTTTRDVLASAQSAAALDSGSRIKVFVDVAASHRQW